MSEMSEEFKSRKIRLATGIVVVALYLALALGSSLTKAPWHDEGQFANAAWNLATSGFMGTTVLDASVPWLKGIGRHTYWVMPLYLVNLAGWFKLFGLSLFSMRLLSVVWGLVALGSWYSMMKSLTGERTVALLTLSLLAFDYIFLMNASTGRMDMMCAALGWAACAVFLRLRETRFPLAVLLSQALVVAGGLTHPNGILPFAGLLFLTLYFDWRRVNLRVIALAAVPYLVGAGLWGWYVLQDREAFVAQFGGNVGGFSGMSGNVNRWVGLTAPWTGFRLEITERYLNAFGLAPHSQGVARLKILVLLVYLAGLAGALSVRRLRQHTATRTVLLLFAIYFVLMALVEGHKSDIYLVHSVPLLAALLALWLTWCWRERALPRPLLAGVLAGFVILQAGGVAYLIRQNHYESKYMPVVNFLRSRGGEGRLLTGSAELGFELGFDRLTDDAWLGYYNGARPDVIVFNRRYEEIDEIFRRAQPEVHRHIEHRLEREYQKVFEFAPYWKVYERR